MPACRLVHSYACKQAFSRSRCEWTVNHKPARVPMPRERRKKHLVLQMLLPDIICGLCRSYSCQRVWTCLFHQRKTLAKLWRRHCLWLWSQYCWLKSSGSSARSQCHGMHADICLILDRLRRARLACSSDEVRLHGAYFKTADFKLRYDPPSRDADQTCHAPDLEIMRMAMTT